MSNQVGRYPMVLADPPWEHQQHGTGRPAYALMSAENITALPVGRIAARDAHCWLRATNASLGAGRQVLESWGFTYRSILTWIKPKIGMGQYLRTQTEHLLLGTRGKAPIQFRGHGSWLDAPMQEHSHKPEKQYAVIERCSPGPYPELFSHRPRAGWHVCADQVDSDVQL